MRALCCSGVVPTADSCSFSQSFALKSTPTPVETTALQNYGLHAHGFVAAVHINYLAGDGRRARAGEEDARLAELIRVATAFERRMLLIVLEHEAKSSNSARGERLHWAGADAINPNFLRSEVVSKVASGSLERSLGNAHHVVMGNDLDGTIVSHRHDASSFGH